MRRRTDRLAAAGQEANGGHEAAKRPRSPSLSRGPAAGSRSVRRVPPHPASGPPLVVSVVVLVVVDQLIILERRLGDSSPFVGQALGIVEVDVVVVLLPSNPVSHGFVPPSSARRAEALGLQQASGQQDRLARMIGLCAERRRQSRKPRRVQMLGSEEWPDRGVLLYAAGSGPTS